MEDVQMGDIIGRYLHHLHNHCTELTKGIEAGELNKASYSDQTLGGLKVVGFFSSGL